MAVFIRGIEHEFTPEEERNDLQVREPGNSHDQHCLDIYFSACRSDRHGSRCMKNQKRKSGTGPLHSLPPKVLSMKVYSFVDKSVMSLAQGSTGAVNSHTRKYWSRDMLGFSSLLALIGLLILLVSVLLLITHRNKNLVIASFITGLLLILLPSTLH